MADEIAPDAPVEEAPEAEVAPIVPARVSLGNVAVLEPQPHPDGSVGSTTEPGQERTQPVLRKSGQRITHMVLHGTPRRQLMDAATLWANDSEEAPAWVECSDPELEVSLSKEFGCPVGRPEDWQEVDEDGNTVPEAGE